jgi:hypothetical protein
MPPHPLFTADWPRYAIAAHISFWIASGLLLVALAAALLGLASGQTTVSLFLLWASAGLLLSVSAIFSGKLYVGNQVFSATPTTGTAARIRGLVIAAMTGALLLFGYSLTFIRGG